MIRKYLFTCLIMLSIFLPLKAQLNDASDYLKALDALALQQNEGMLPIQGLDTTQIAFISTAAEPFEQALEIAQRYTIVSKEVLPENLSNISQWVDKLRQEYDQFLLVLSQSSWEDGSDDFKNTLRSVMNQTPTALILLGDQVNPRSQKLQKWAKAVVHAPNSLHGQSLAIQLAFGGVGKSNIAATRLGYAPAGALAVNQQLLEDSIAAIVKHGLQEEAYPGAQVLVAYKGKVIYHETFGSHKFENSKPVLKTDVYDLASVTKVSSALAALMKWQGEGKFDLEAPLDQYYPDFKGSNKGDIVFRQMLAHNARLRPWIPYWQGALKKNAKYPWKNNWDSERINDFKFRKNTFSRDSTADFNRYIAPGLWQHKDYQQVMMKSIKKSPLNEESGYVYSGLLFYLLPNIVAQQSGMDYETYLKSTFYKPLGAHTITYNPLRYIELDRIIPTEQDTFFRMTQLHGYVHDEGAAMMGGVSANAGLFASANDLAKLFQMYMNYGAYGGKQYIAEAAVKEFARCQYCEEGNRRGLGFDKPLIEYDAKSSSVAEQASPASFGHSGYTGTFAWVDPEKDLMFIFLSNRVYPTRLNRKLYTLGIRPRIHNVLYEAIETNK